MIKFPSKKLLEMQQNLIRAFQIDLNKDAKLLNQCSTKNSSMLTLLAQG